MVETKILQQACVLKHCVKLKITIKKVNSVWMKVFFGVFWYRFIYQQVYLFFCYESKPFCILTLISMWDFFSDSWGISPGNIIRICPRFSWGILGQVTHLDQSIIIMIIIILILTINFYSIFSLWSKNSLQIKIIIYNMILKKY